MATLADADRPPTRAIRVAIWLHWLIGLSVIVNIGQRCADRRSAARKRTAKAMNIAGAGDNDPRADRALRLLWRLGLKPPPLPAGTPSWQRPVSKILHFLFYLLLILLPLSGWVWMSARRSADRLLRIVHRSVDRRAVKGARRHAARTTRTAGHHHARARRDYIMAVLKHQYVDRTRLMGRMNPIRSMPLGGRSSRS